MTDQAVLREPVGTMRLALPIRRLVEARIARDFKR